MKNISILLPTYNDRCAELAGALHRQAEKIRESSGGTFEYEVLVGDDGSTDEAVITENEGINKLPRCRYIRRGRNEGRSAIRNFLASQARYEQLLFIDGDMKMGGDDYLSNYVNAPECDVIYGGYVIKEDDGLLKHNLRYIYERGNRANSCAEERRKRPYSNFNTKNFLVWKSVFTAFPLDERFRRYGYEDVFWGKTMMKKDLEIMHIDNPLVVENFESNVDFLAKTEEGLDTLYEFRDELRSFSDVISAAEKVGKLHLKGLFKAFFKRFGGSLKSRLTGNKPSIFLFNVYKLGYYLMKGEE